jgi:hypothetical protein
MPQGRHGRQTYGDPWSGAAPTMAARARGGNDLEAALTVATVCSPHPVAKGVHYGMVVGGLLARRPCYGGSEWDRFSRTHH